MSVYLMERAGYDPEAAVRFWSRFGRRGLNFLGSPDPSQLAQPDRPAGDGDRRDPQRAGGRDGCRSRPSARRR